MCEKVLISKDIEETMKQVYPKSEHEVGFIVFKDLTRQQAMKNKENRKSKEMNVKGLGKTTVIYADILDVMEARPLFLSEWCGVRV